MYTIVHVHARIMNTMSYTCVHVSCTYVHVHVVALIHLVVNGTYMYIHFHLSMCNFPLPPIAGKTHKQKLCIFAERPILTESHSFLMRILMYMYPYSSLQTLLFYFLL